MATCHVCDAELAPTAQWCGQCLTPVPTGGDPGERAAPEPDVGPAPEYSAWRAGPYSFGPFGKLLITAIVIGAGIVLAYVAGSVGWFYGVAGLALILLLILVYSILAAMGLWGLWRPTRVK